MRSIPPQRGQRLSGRGFPRPVRESTVPQQFQRLQATELYCSKCRQATPTREHLLLVLPDGNLYDYRCARCGTSTGSRSEKAATDVQIYPG